MKLSFFVLSSIFLVGVSALAEFVPSGDAEEAVLAQVEEAEQPAALHFIQRQPNQAGRNTMRTSIPQSSAGSIFTQMTGVAGAVMTTPVGSSVDGYSNTTTDFTGGATIDVFRGSLVFETGLLFRQLSAATTYESVSLSFVGSYVSIPTFAKYYFSGQNRSSFFLKAGAYNSIAVKKQVAVAVPGMTVSGQDDSMQSFDFAPAAGLGGMIRLSRSTYLVLEADYARSVTPIYTGGSAVYFSSFTGTAGIAIKL